MTVTGAMLKVNGYRWSVVILILTSSGVKFHEGLFWTSRNTEKQRRCLGKQINCSM